MSKNETPIAYMLYGFVCSGKTTYAKKLEQNKGAICFSPDEWMVRLYGVNPPVEKFSENYDSVLEIIEGYWTLLLRLNVDVVLDYGFWNREYRDYVRKKVKESGGTPKLLSFAIPEKTALTRCEERNKNLQEDFLIIKETFDEMKGRFQSLGEDEDFIAIYES